MKGALKLAIAQGAIKATTHLARKKEMNCQTTSRIRGDKTRTRNRKMKPMLKDIINIYRHYVLNLYPLLVEKKNKRKMNDQFTLVIPLFKSVSTL